MSTLLLSPCPIRRVVILTAYLLANSYGTQYHGLEALQTGFLVALAQLIPDHQVQLLRKKITIRVRDIPMLYVSFSNVACLLGYPSPFILIQFGWLISWAYLRFYRWNPDSGTRGDRSEAFSLVNWFPPFLHAPVIYISNFLHSVFLRLRIIPDFRYDYVSSNDLEYGLGSNPNMTNGANPLSARAEAERRRAMALKALDQRVASSPSAGQASSSRGSQPLNQLATAAAAKCAPAEVVFAAPGDDSERATAPAPTASKSKTGSAGSAFSQQEEEAEWPASDDETEDSDGDIGRSGRDASGRTKKVPK